MKIFKDPEVEEELEQVKELRKVIEASPMTQQIIAEMAAETLAKRQEAAGKIEISKTEREKVIPKLQEVVKEKEAKYLEAKAALDGMLQEVRTARFKLSSETNSRETDIQNLETILYESASPIISETIQLFQGKLDELCRPGKISIQRMGSERNIFTMTKKILIESNLDAIHAALRYYRDGIKQLEDMKLQPEFDSQKVESLKGGAPKIDVWSESTAEKPLPRVNVNPPRKSDSQLNFEMGKLKEKFQKVMGKPW